MPAPSTPFRYAHPSERALLCNRWQTPLKHCSRAAWGVRACDGPHCFRGLALATANAAHCRMLTGHA